MSFLSPVPHLPPYRGPYDVGTSLYEVPVSSLDSTSHVPDPSITTIKFRIFYPTSQKTGKATYWLPDPQTRWLSAYADFLGASPRMSRLFSYVPFLKWSRVPAISGTDIVAPPKETNNGRWPVMVFSHGLGGNCNAYSQVLGSLASAGVVCVAPEHRDGSCPVSSIKDASEKTVREINYVKLSHSPDAETLHARNRQFRVRLWEMELVYTALLKMNAGEKLQNFEKGVDVALKSLLDLRPGQVTWTGHSFGAASTVQFVKSVFYAQYLPSTTREHQHDSNWRPLYTAAENGDLCRQVTKDSPVVLLDLWTMPLKGDVTKWLWEKPMPCYANEDMGNVRDETDSGFASASDGDENISETFEAGNRSRTTNSTIAVMSAEFYRWSDLLARTKAVLSAKPALALSLGDSDGVQSMTKPKNQPRLFHASKTAHLSQSDFGLLFAWVARRFMKVEADAERTVLYNVRAILELFRERNVHVRSVYQDGQEDKILIGGRGEIEDWERIAF